MTGAPGAVGGGVRVAAFCMPEHGHFQRLGPMIARLSRAGAEVHVLTDVRFREEVERHGGRFVDLFGRYPIEAADATSVPVPCRFVTFAAAYADAICADVARLRATIVVHDSFALIARLVAERLGLPRVNVCAGHAVTPARFRSPDAEGRRIEISPACLHAVERLRNEHGLADASPFSYVGAPSEALNLYCEPAQFLNDDERRAFEPVGFFGSLPDAEPAEPAATNTTWFDASRPRLRRIYVSFGTVVWRAYPDRAFRAMLSIVLQLGERDDVDVVVSLGGQQASGTLRQVLERGGARVHDYVDQWAVLREADVFVTHQGLNSTHEAVWHGVPMLSYPFFWDQPALAGRCESLALALPLVQKPRAELTHDEVHAALDRLGTRQLQIEAGLIRAREWELETIAGRDALVGRIVDLAR